MDLIFLYYQPKGRRTGQTKVRATS